MRSEMYVICISIKRNVVYKMATVKGVNYNTEYTPTPQYVLKFAHVATYTHKLNQSNQSVCIIPAHGRIIVYYRPKSTVPTRKSITWKSRSKYCLMCSSKRLNEKMLSSAKTSLIFLAVLLYEFTSINIYKFKTPQKRKTRKACESVRSKVQ